MKVLVVYDSLSGNTEKVARKIDETSAKAAPVISNNNTKHNLMEWYRH